MQKTGRNRTKKTGGGADLAFAIVVLTTYFATFSSMQTARPLEIFFIVLLGTIYITLGIYGYAYCVERGTQKFVTIYFVLQIIFGGLIVYLTKGSGLSILILLPLTGHTVILLHSRLTYVTNIVIFLAFCIAIYFSNGSWELVVKNFPNFIAGQIFIIAFVQMAVNEERLKHNAEDLAKDLTEANERILNYAARVEELTVTQERNRLAREIHDGLGHYLTTINMQIQAAMALLHKSVDEANENLIKAQALSREALNDVRNSVSSLREQPGSLVDRINGLLDNVKSLGLDAAFQFPKSMEPLAPSVDIALFRAAQEGISNTLKHSNATKMLINLTVDNSIINMTIEDNGAESVSVGEGFGLKGISERIELINGKVEYYSRPEGGFIINIKVPR